MVLLRSAAAELLHLTALHPQRASLRLMVLFPCRVLGYLLKGLRPSAACRLLNQACRQLLVIAHPEPVSPPRARRQYQAPRHPPMERLTYHQAPKYLLNQLLRLVAFCPLS